MANKNNVRKLTMAELKKHDKKLDEKIVEYVNIGEDQYTVKIDRTFRISKMHKVLDDFIQFITEAKDDEAVLGDATPYMSLLIIKHFTDVYVPDKQKDALDLLYVLVDNKVLDKILNAMPEEELTKVLDLLSDAMGRVRENIEKDVSELDSVYDSIENKELKEMVDSKLEAVENAVEEDENIKKDD